jgi:hypothetical protein
MEFDSRKEQAPRFITPSRRQRRGESNQSHQEAVSRAIAAIARQLPEVKSFRREILNGHTLRPEEIEPWIEQRRKEQIYPHAVLVRLKAGFTLKYQSGWNLEPPISSAKNDQIEGLSPVDSLDYARPGSDWKYGCVPVGRDGTLRVVRQLAKKLATLFNWQDAQSTVFLLTDWTPLIDTFLVTLNPPPSLALPYEGGELACLTRVTLTMDPMMTPRELSEKYARLRNRLLVRKPRAQSSKHLELAIFATKYPDLDRKNMEQWGREFPRWKYSQVSRFAKEARDARRRLLHRSAADVWPSLAPTEK